MNIEYVQRRNFKNKSKQTLMAHQLRRRTKVKRSSFQNGKAILLPYSQYFEMTIFLEKRVRKCHFQQLTTKHVNGNL